MWCRFIRIVAFVPRMPIRRRRVRRPVIRTHLSSRFIHCHDVAIRGSSYLLAPSTKTRHFAFAHHSSVNDVISWQQSIADVASTKNLGDICEKGGMSTDLSARVNGLAGA